MAHMVLILPSRAGGDLCIYPDLVDRTLAGTSRSCVNFTPAVNYMKIDCPPYSTAAAYRSVAWDYAAALVR